MPVRLDHVDRRARRPSRCSPSIVIVRSSRSPAIASSRACRRGPLGAAGRVAADRLVARLRHGKRASIGYSSTPSWDRRHPRHAGPTAVPADRPAAYPEPHEHAGGDQPSTTERPRRAASLLAVAGLLWMAGLLWSARATITGARRRRDGGHLHRVRAARRDLRQPGRRRGGRARRASPLTGRRPHAGRDDPLRGRHRRGPGARPAGRAHDHHDQHRGLGVRGGRRHGGRRGDDRRRAGRLPRAAGGGRGLLGGGRRVPGRRRCSTFVQDVLFGLFGAGDSSASQVGAASWFSLTQSVLSGLAAGVAGRTSLLRRSTAGTWPLVRAGRRRAGPAAGRREVLDPDRRRAGAGAGRAGQRAGADRAADAQRRRLNSALIVLFVGRDHGDHRGRPHARAGSGADDDCSAARPARVTAYHSSS